ncbi:MAG TPA: PQQ-binding-like beta-propeller repeat protein [Blastocatellia bacterium]|nr:PQQ-binding-like beta-propeller repeat protein [Blastocatellia bacterium]
MWKTVIQFIFISASKVSLMLVSLLLVVPGASAGDSPMFRGNLQHTGAYPATGVQRLNGVKWTVQTNGPVRSSPALVNGVIYFGSGDGNLYAVKADTGQMVWKFNAGSAVHSSPAIAGGLVYFSSTDGSFYALDLSTGQQNWKFQTANRCYEGGWDYFSSSPAVSEGTVYAGSGDGCLYALNARDGKVKWKFKTDGIVRSSPAIYDGTIYFGSFDGNLYALNMADGTLRWKFKTEGNPDFPKGEIQSSPAVGEGVVAFGSRDYNLYVLDGKTGKQLWRFPHDGSWVITSPVIHDQAVYAGSSDGDFFQAVDLKTGKEIWRVRTKKNVLGSPALAGGVLYVPCEDRSIYAVDAATGAARWKFTTGDRVLSSPVVDNGAVYAGSDDGNLYALSGEAAPPRFKRAVFWDERVVYHWFQGHEQVRDYFVAQGYQLLDSRRLYGFLKARVTDKVPSVVVFAVDTIPSPVAPEADDKSLLRQYLTAGGKIVWLGLDPLIPLLDASTGQPYGYDASKMTGLLGVTSVGGENGDYGVTATAEGKKWGLPDWWTGGWSVDPKTVSEVLGVDEFGRAVAWVKNYGGAEGTGFVRLWGREEAMTSLASIKAVAEYGLK